MTLIMTEATWTEWTTHFSKKNTKQGKTKEKHAIHCVDAYRSVFCDISALMKRHPVLFCELFSFKLLTNENTRIITVDWKLSQNNREIRKNSYKNLPQMSKQNLNKNNNSNNNTNTNSCSSSNNNSNTHLKKETEKKKKKHLLMFA